jgi:hypothetical protein
MQDIDNHFKKNRPDKRLMRKIEYAYEQFSIANSFNEIDFALPKKYLRKDNIKRAIRKKIVES